MAERGDVKAVSQSFRNVYIIINKTSKGRRYVLPLLVCTVYMFTLLF